MKLIKAIADGISLVENDTGELKFLCHGVLGSEPVRQANRGRTFEMNSILEIDGKPIHREYGTLPEAEAYWQGIGDLEGYNEFAPMSFDDYRKCVQPKPDLASAAA